MFGQRDYHSFSFSIESGGYLSIRDYSADLNRQVGLEVVLMPTRAVEAAGKHLTAMAVDEVGDSLICACQNSVYKFDRGTGVWSDLGARLDWGAVRGIEVGGETLIAGIAHGSAFLNIWCVNGSFCRLI